MIFITIARLLRHLMNLARIVHIKKNLPKDLHLADYHLAHANQAGRYNIRQGIMPPASGHWLNNPLCRRSGFVIEADFIGLMAPAMLPEALDIASRVGHIMNSGDGFYGGAFVAALYSSAFYEKVLKRF